MGLFDTLSDIANTISASVELGFAGGVSDVTMSYYYLNASMDDIDKETVSILKDTLGYGDDAYVCLAHMDNVTKMTMAKVTPDTIAKVQNISKEMVLRILQMGIEYSEYKNTGKLPKVIEHTPIGGVPAKAVSMARYCKSIYNEEAMEKAIEEADKNSHQQDVVISVKTSSNDNVLFKDAADTLTATMSAAEK